MHAKRQTMEKSWPLPRKGTKYIVVPSHEHKNGIPITIILRDMMKLAKNRREVQKILAANQIIVNGEKVKKANFSILPFEPFQIGNKKYELTFSEKGDFEIGESRSEERILKVVGKKILKGGKIQLNLIYGKNIITTEKINAGSSVVILNQKIIRVIPMETEREVIIFSGKHRGKKGAMKNVKNKIAVISSGDEEINVPLKSLMVIK